jgi:PEP-CTERM motif
MTRVKSTSFLDQTHFFWLSAPRPIVPPGTTFDPDLQAWIRNEDLQPNWLRVGTDIVGGNPASTFNATFTLSGLTIPEPSSMVLLSLGGLTLLGAACVRGRSRTT